MKEVEVTLWDLEKEDIKAMPGDKQILRYDTLHKKYDVIPASKAVGEKKEYCHYFSFDEENKND